MQLFVYCCTPCPDHKSRYLKSECLERGATWRSILGVGDEDAAKLIRNDKIDILVELTGHTANNRLSIMRYRPAPVQMTWIGYPNTTGMEAIDYRCVCWIAVCTIPLGVQYIQYCSMPCFPQQLTKHIGSMSTFLSYPISKWNGGFM